LTLVTQNVDDLHERAGSESVIHAIPDIALNGAGMFVCGVPNGDNGQTGKKLVMDAYGSTVPIGGGAWSGRISGRSIGAAACSRALAQRLVEAHGCDEARVTLEYDPGATRRRTARRSSVDAESCSTAGR
jgi:S-adenosylmethionine synthetase